MCVSDLEVHHTIAEMMILANVEVAKFIVKMFPMNVCNAVAFTALNDSESDVFYNLQALIRRHVPPAMSRFAELFGLADKLVSLNMTLAAKCQDQQNTHTQRKGG